MNKIVEFLIIKSFRYVLMLVFKYCDQSDEDDLNDLPKAPKLLISVIRKV